MAGAAGGGGIYHYHYNHLGSVQVVTNESGMAVEYIRYKPYGEVRGHYNSDGTEQADNTCADDHYCHEFTGYDTEPISGLQYAGARFYDPELGMFLTHDPVRQFANPYAYGPWDPVNGTDPNGTFFFELFLIAAITFFDVGSKTGDTKTALIAGVVAGITAGVTSVAVAKIAPVVAPLLSPTEKFAVQLAAVGAGGYATYESAQHGLRATAALAAFGTVQLAYGALTDAIGAKPAQGENSQIISDETRSDWARSELEPAQSTVASDTRAQAVYGESASLRPQPNDPASAADLQTAREWIADVSERNPNVRLASPNPNNPIEMAVWNDAVRASQAAQRWNLLSDVRHFFMRQEGLGIQQPWWATGRTPYNTFGPFVVPRGGAIPAGNRVYIDFYRGIP